MPGVIMGKTNKAHGNESADGISKCSPAFPNRTARNELVAMGKSLREKCPRASHAIWKPPSNRPDPLELLVESSEGRIPQLIPIRYGRMMQTPFTFYRGAALNMAADLAVTPSTGLRVQACGDAHLLNFGAYATPERHVIFDLNDLDETLPAPWEWDVKRLAASFILACRHNRFSDAVARDSTLVCVRSYREAMTQFSQMRALEVWYASLDMERIVPQIQDELTRKRAEKVLAKVRQRNVVEHDFPQLVTTAGLHPEIKENPPLIYHWREQGHDEFTANVRQAFAHYRETLEEDRRMLLDRYKLLDIAIKVVGVGSVGTWCAVALLMAGDDDPLFLQIKEARRSVLETYAAKSVHANHGQRVVAGCRLMQSACDLFLGWTESQLGRHLYVRQLKDMKIKMPSRCSRRVSCVSMPTCVGGHSPGRTLARVSRPRSVATSVKAMPSTKPSRTSR
jgi:uncharacterized protein (DUF2252 family)